MIRQRVRIRFAKTGDLKLIGHRDLIRAWERLLRRAGLKLGMSQGFHPKPRMNFPSALALGISGLDELVEVELAEQVDADRAAALLRRHAPPGLTIHSVTLIRPPAAKARAAEATYEIDVPAARQTAARAAMSRFWAASAWPVARPGRGRPLDVRGPVAELRLEGSALRMRLSISQDGSVRPREVLTALGLEDLLRAGCELRRTSLGLAAEPPRRDPAAAAQSTARAVSQQG